MRQSSKTPRKIQIIRNMVSDGCNSVEIASALGIKPDTVQSWAKQEGIALPKSKRRAA
jgi:uncharacterized protein YjcR